MLLQMAVFPSKRYFLLMSGGISWELCSGSSFLWFPAEEASWRAQCPGRGKVSVQNSRQALRTSSQKWPILLLLKHHGPRQVTRLNPTLRGQGSVPRRNWNIYLACCKNYRATNAKSLHKAWHVKVVVSIFLSSLTAIMLGRVRNVGLGFRGSSQWSCIQIILWQSVAMVKKIYRIPSEKLSARACESS